MNSINEEETMSSIVDERIAFVIFGGEPFTSDDVTEDGSWTLDPAHTPNSIQSAVGSAFQLAARRGLIESDGRVTHSCSPHRKGGSIRVWRATEAGIEWANSIFGDPDLAGS
jgi:hypothetical protein